jgi:ferredoxin
MLYIDENECTGCEYCAVQLPKVFSMNEKKICVPSSYDGISKEEIQFVIDNCPALCIFIK